MTHQTSPLTAEQAGAYLVKLAKGGAPYGAGGPLMRVLVDCKASTLLELTTQVHEAIKDLQTKLEDMERDRDMWMDLVGTCAVERPGDKADVTEVCKRLRAEWKAGDASLAADNARLREALTKAAKQFRYYEQSHSAKGTTEGNQKAETNKAFALMCESALATLPAEAKAAPPAPMQEGLTEEEATIYRFAKSRADNCSPVNFVVVQKLVAIIDRLSKPAPMAQPSQSNTIKGEIA